MKSDFCATTVLEMFLNRQRKMVLGTCIIVSSFGYSGALAQSRLADHDSTYYEAYPEQLIGRVYSSYKYTSVELNKGNDAPRIGYRPNNTINTGIGATYRKLTLNVAYGFGFMNKDDERGETKRLDLQSRVYTRKWAIDLYGQFYKGFYMYPKGKAARIPEAYYVRPDLKINLGGIAAYRLFNDKRFSFRSAFVQDEWQKKSAGSFLAGGEAYVGVVKGDSALIPGALSTIYDDRKINKALIMEIGPGAGYAYTQVLPLHLYLTGCLIMNVNVSLVQESSANSKVNHVDVNADLLYRFSAGYNNGNWNINFFRVSNKVSAKGDLSGNRYVFDTGIYRFVIAKRLNAGPRTKRLLKPIDRIMGDR